MKETILIRHAESFYNRNETDNLDSNLTELGLKQAVAMALYLDKNKEARHFHGFVSPLKRCLETAWAVQISTGVQFKVWPLISEYGATWSKVPYTVTVPVRREDYPMFDWSMYKAAQLFTAESFQQFLGRMREVLSTDLPDKTLLVSHGAVVYTLVDLLIGGNVIEEGYQQVTNASVSKIVEDKPLYTFKNEWKEG